jgi:hypothetical protein
MIAAILGEVLIAIFVGVPSIIVLGILVWLTHNLFAEVKPRNWELMPALTPFFEFALILVVLGRFADLAGGRVVDRHTVMAAAMKSPGRCRVRPGLSSQCLQGVMRTLRDYSGRKACEKTYSTAAQSWSINRRLPRPSTEAALVVRPELLDRLGQFQPMVGNLEPLLLIVRRQWLFDLLLTFDGVLSELIGLAHNLFAGVTTLSRVTLALAAARNSACVAAASHSCASSRNCTRTACEVAVRALSIHSWAYSRYCASLCITRSLVAE